MRDSNLRILNRDTIKYIAIFTMLLNHIAEVFLTPDTILHEAMVSIGYFTAITMCYFLVEGYEYTKSRKKYAQRLLLFAVLSEIPFCLAFAEDGIMEFVGFNMIFTLFICFCIVHVMKRMWNRQGAELLVIGLIFATVYSDWGVMAPIFTILFVRAGHSETEKRKAWRYAILFYGFCTLLDAISTYPLSAAIIRTATRMTGPVLAAICIQYLYNGKKAERGQLFSKWFFYLFYPVHLLILGHIRIAL